MFPSHEIDPSLLNDGRHSGERGLQQHLNSILCFTVTQDRDAGDWRMYAVTQQTARPPRLAASESLIKTHHFLQAGAPKPCQLGTNLSISKDLRKKRC